MIAPRSVPSSRWRKRARRGANSARHRPRSRRRLERVDRGGARTTRTLGRCCPTTSWLGRRDSSSTCTGTAISPGGWRFASCWGDTWTGRRPRCASPTAPTGSRSCPGRRCVSTSPTPTIWPSSGSPSSIGWGWTSSASVSSRTSTAWPAGSSRRGSSSVFHALPDASKTQGFFNCWTRKEAFVKAVGEGLAHPLDVFDVTLRPGEEARLLEVEGSPARAAAWSLFDISPMDGWVGAVAVECADAVLKHAGWLGAPPTRPFSASSGAGRWPARS